MSKTTYLTDALLNAVYRNTAFTSPTTVYAGLLTAVTDKEAGTVTEASFAGYARQAITFAAPVVQSGGRAVKNSSSVTFPAKSDAGSVTIIGVGIYDAVSAGNLLFIAFLDGADPFEFVSLSLAGDTLQIPAHGLSSNQRVRLEAVPGGSTLPAGLSENTDYYKIDSTADAIQLSASAGPGAAVNITAEGKGLLYKVTPVTVNQNDQAQFATNALVVIED